MAVRFRHRAAGVVGALVLASGTVSCASSGTASDVALLAADPPQGCVVLDNLSEEIVGGTETEEGGPWPSVGDSGTYVDYLYDKDNKKIGTVFGEINVPFARPDGHLMEWAHERIELVGGAIEVQGMFDVTRAESEHTWEFGPAVGVSGGYREKVGRRYFRIVEFRKKLDAKIELCPAGAPR
jgi:hypothetical protein